MSHFTKPLLRALAILAPCLLLVAWSNPSPRQSFFAYDFTLRWGPVRNVDHLQTLGYDGVVTRVETPLDLYDLHRYASHVRTIPDFDLLAFLPYRFGNLANSQVWRDALPTLAAVDAPLWVIVRDAPSTEAVRRLLLRMAIESEAHGVETVIYPHWNTDIETAAEASAMIRSIGHPNLKNSLHTCHEIRSGNQYALPSVVDRHAGLSSLVTIAGADANAYAGPPVPGVDWSDAIKPLDKGDFSLLPFLQSLNDRGYAGPVILHTFGIVGDPTHLQRSIRKYAEYQEQVVP